jgi:hypothetical protein
MGKPDFAEYKALVAQAAEARLMLQRLEARIGELEANFDSAAASVAPEHADLEPRFRRMLQIFRDLGGRAKLRDVTSKTGLTGPGTLAQIRFLESKKLVRKYDHGVYELVSR